MINFFKYVEKHGGKTNLIKCDFGNTLGTGNPSILKHNDKFYMTFRCCEYTFINCIKGFYHADLDIIWYPTYRFENVPANFYSYNFITEYDIETNSVRNIKELELCSKERPHFYNGAEDIRLSHDKNNNICMSYSICEGERISMNISRLDNDFNVIDTIKYLNKDKYEKNWMPVIDGYEKYVRKAFENVILVDRTENNAIFRSQGNPDSELTLLGSSQIIPYKDNYICLVHNKRMETTPNSSYLQYVHKFIVLNKKLEKIKESEWFSFAGFPIEFTCGMHIEDNELFLPVALYDCATYMIRLDMDSVMDFIDGKTDNEYLSDEEHTKISKHVLNELPNNYAAKIAFNTHLAKNENSKSKKIEYYTNALCALKGFTTHMYNNYMHILCGQDFIIDMIRTIK